MVCSLLSNHIHQLVQNIQFVHFSRCFEAEMKGVSASGVPFAFETVRGSTNMLHLRLVVRAGSLLETNNERGAAHFVEHLGFRGTRKFGHGDLVRLLGSFGMSYGSDVNARTSLSDTVWQLDVPFHQLALGLSILNEWAFHIRFTPEDVEAERKVILQEYRQKQTASQRAKAAFWESLAQGVANRTPIGTLEFIEQVQAPQLHDFYSKHYHLSNMSIVCVVEESTQTNMLTKDMFERELNAIFSQENTRTRSAPPAIFPSSLEALCSPGDGSPFRFLVVHDPDLVHASVSLEMLSDFIQPSQHGTFFRRDAVKRVLSSVLDERFRQRRILNETPYHYDVSFGVALRQPYVEMSCVKCDLPHDPTVHDVEQALNSLILQLRACAMCGFTASEVEYAKTKWMHTISSQVRSAEVAVEEWVGKRTSVEL